MASGSGKPDDIEFEQRNDQSCSYTWLTYRMRRMADGTGLACAPQVRAIEEADGPSRVNVRFTVHLPLFGLLIAYDGYLDVEELQS